MAVILLSLLFGALVLADPDLTPEQASLVTSLPIYNGEMKEAPPLPEARVRDGWPYGLLLTLQGNRIVGGGTISNLGGGLLQTANHCADSVGGWDKADVRYVAVFYDKTGHKNFCVIDHSEFLNARGDYAILRTHSSSVATWHDLSSLPLQKFDPAANSRSVRILGADPFPGLTAAILQSRTAQVRTSEGRLAVHLDDAPHNAPIIRGNSGAIVVDDHTNALEGVMVTASYDHGAYGEAAPLPSSFLLTREPATCAEALFFFGGNQLEGS